jgi:hypothetical protein
MDYAFQIRSSIRPPFPPLITIQDIVILLSINTRPRKKFNAFNIYRLTTIFYMQNNNNILPISFNFFRSITTANWISETPSVKEVYQRLAIDTNSYYNII